MVGQSARTAWVTGASSGIGEAIAKAFVVGGGRAILSGRNVADLERVTNESGAPDRCHVLAFDTTDFEAIPSMVKAAVASSGSVDILVNTAGISQRFLAVDTAFEVYECLVDADRSARGASDVTIDRGIEPDEGAHIIWNAVAEATREIIIAQGLEAHIVLLRAQEPERLFDMAEAMIANGYTQKIAAK